MSLVARLCVVAVVVVAAVAVAVAADSPSDTAGKAGAPGQVCEGLKVKGKKTDEQRAAFKACIQDAVAERQADNAASDRADDKRVPRKNPAAR
jgi:hypothetical protein